MTVMLTGLAHPGPRAPERRQTAPTDIRRVEGVLHKGGVLMEEVGAFMARAGIRGGVMWLEGVVCDPFRYVLPAYATDGLHAAFYSATHAPEGRVTIGASSASLGHRDGAPFLHCHGKWVDAGGRMTMGHVLPFDCILAEDARVRAVGAVDAWFEGVPDAETNFTLFSPEGGREGARGLLLRLRPDEDVVTAIEAVCAEAGISDAQVHGIGSICRARFETGAVVDCIATEVRIDTGHLREGRAQIDVSMVDVAGGIHSGRLQRSANPVGVTFELLVEPLG